MALSIPTSKKKGVSIMVGYVLLVIIAVAISALVYGYLYLYVPKVKPACEKEVPIIVQDITCTLDTDALQLTLVNKGLFKIDAVYIRLSKEGRRVKKLVNEEIYLFPNTMGFALPPGQSYTPPKFSVTEITNHVAENYVLEVEPAVLSEGKLALCPQFTITQEIECK